MDKKIKLVIGALIAVAAIALGVTLVSATGSDSEAPITGDALDRASQAALEHTGGGEVTETELGDEESYYEVEVTMDDGTMVDVQLDSDFNVVGSESDQGEDEEDEDEEDGEEDEEDE